MPYTKAGKQATIKYMKNNLDDIKIRVPKGDREKYKEFAASKGKSLNSLIIELLNKAIQEK